MFGDVLILQEVTHAYRPRDMNNFKDEIRYSSSAVSYDGGYLPPGICWDQMLPRNALVSKHKNQLESYHRRAQGHIRFDGIWNREKI